MTEQFVIVGGGLAGAKAAETLRGDGFTGRVVLVGAESDRPYERPPLSKALLLGSATPESTHVHEADWYTAHDVDLLLGRRAEAIDRSAHAVALDDGTTVPYDKLLLTTGSSPRRLDVPGADLGGVHYLRTLHDSDRLGQRLTEGANVVVIGGGWIGLEVAAAARHHGASVTVVEMTVLPLQRVLGADVARVFMSLHEAHGVTFRCGVSVRELRGDTEVRSVVLADGTELPADVVVVGVGIWPNTELATDAALTVADGIVVDAALRTSDERIFAAGDVASAFHPLIGTHIRVEHWANALHGGAAAARSMLGQAVSFDRVPYFFSDQYDLGMEYAGYATPGNYDAVVFRGDPASASREFLAFWVRGGCVLAGMNANVWDVQDGIQALVRAGHAGTGVDVTKLADPSVPLDNLLI